MCFPVLRTQFLSRISCANIEDPSSQRSCFSNIAFELWPVASRLVCLARVRSSRCSKLDSLRGPQQTSAGGFCNVVCPNGWPTIVARVAVQGFNCSTVLIASAGMPCGRGRHVMRIIARMDSTQDSDAGSSQEIASPPSQMPETPETIRPLAARRRCFSLRRLSQETTSPPSQMPETPETIWPLAARRRCFSLRRDSQKGIEDPVSGQATSYEVPPTVWPVSVRGHIRRLRKAESAGTDVVWFMLDLTVRQV